MEYYGSFEEEDFRPDPRKNPKWVKEQRDRFDENMRKRQQNDPENTPDYDPWSGGYY